MCKKVNLGIEEPFRTVVYVTRHAHTGALAIMNTSRFISSMVASGQIKLIPGYGFDISFTFETAGFSRKASVRECTLKGMRTTHICEKLPDRDPTAPFPLGEGMHRVTVVKGPTWHIERSS